MTNSCSFKFGEKRKIVRRKCLIWYSRQSEKNKLKIFSDVSLSICRHLKQGNSINLSKSLTRDELGYGYKLVDHIARSSMFVLNLQGEIKQENISKQTKT